MGRDSREDETEMESATDSAQTIGRYRSLSSVGRTLLPRAEKMHEGGMPWEMIALQLRVSPSVLYIWRKLGR